MAKKWSLPIKTDWMQKQMDHEPSRQYAEDIHNFVKCLKPSYKKALEIGSAWGISTLAILGAGKGTLKSVDPDKTRAYKEVELNRYSDRWEGVESRSKAFWQDDDDTYDFIYIDGSHLFHDIYNDLFQAWDKLEPGGLLMIDDFTHKLNKDIDVDAKEPIFGVSYALCCFIAERDIRKQRTTMKVWATKKPKGGKKHE